MTALPARATAPPIRPIIGRDEWILRAALALVLALLVVALVVPLYILLSKSFQDGSGRFIGLANYTAYFASPAPLASIQNSFVVAVVSTVITIPLAFAYAYGINRSRMPGKGLFRTIAMIPLLTPSLLFALSLVQLFGNQGMIKGVLLGHSIYGPIGIVIGMVFAHFPHAFLVIGAALTLADRRLYEAAECLGAGKLKIFLTVTLPGAKYGLISATIVSMTLSLTDFGIPKVIGGQYDVLATDIYKQVVGQQNFERGAVVSVVLLIPAIVAFVIDRFAQRRQVALLSTRAVPYEPKPSRVFDAAMFVYCLVIAGMIVAVIVVAGISSFIKFWPYDLGLTLRNYQFDRFAGGGWKAYLNSLEMATWTAVVGTTVVFVGAYLVEKSRTMPGVRKLVQMLAVTPMAVPGLVLGLSYIFFFNKPGNPFHFIYGTMAILVLVTIVHYYTVMHLTVLTALKQIDAEFESVSDSLKTPRYRTLWRVTVPICMPAILDVSIYFFLGAMTTVSAVVFLHSAHTGLASLAVLNMDDAGEFAPAAAMAMVIVATCIAARVVHWLLTRGLTRRTQAWRVR